jgi:putative lipoprotein
VLEGTSRIVAEAGPAAASGSPEAVGLVGAWNLAEMGPTADFAHLQPTIEFRADGTMSGFAGCNTFNGSYTTDGAALTFGPVATTKMACERPGSAVEADYLNALAGVTGWAVEPDGRLRLDGAVPLRYTRAS